MYTLNVLKVLRLVVRRNNMTIFNVIMYALIDNCRYIQSRFHEKYAHNRLKYKIDDL